MGFVPSVAADRLVRPSRRIAWLLTCITLLACLTLAASSQSPQQAVQQQPRFRAEAALVRVDAYVTRKDQPVDDLRAEDFEVFEDGVRQQVETFEYVRRTREKMGAAAPIAGEKGGRLFVLFIDTYHLPWVDRERLERRQIDTRSPQPLFFPPVLPPPIPDDTMLRDAMRQMVDRLVGEGDRIAVLTPDMWAAAPAFGEKRAIMDELATRPLEAYAAGNRPPETVRYEACFPNGPWIEPMMRTRFRLNRTFTALRELVTNLELLREERKAVIVVSRGWDPPPRILNYVDPRRSYFGQDDTVCSEERYALADKDFTAWFSRIVAEAKRANVAFYSFYAHPLVTYGREGPDIDEQTRRFEHQWGNLRESGQTTRVTSPFADIEHQRYRWHGSLEDLADDTDGQAILKMTDFERGLDQIASGLSSYYLLGYYSTNRAHDGRYRKISVRVKRKGVDVRARPGYRAIMPAEVLSASGKRPEPVAPEVNAALSPLARLRADVPFHLLATTDWDQSAGGWRLRLVGEIDREQLPRAEWRNGWRAELGIARADGDAVALADITVKAGEAYFVVTCPTDEVVQPGEYVVRGKAYAADGETVFEDRVPVTVPAGIPGSGEPAAGNALFLRRTNTPKSVFQPTASQRFTKREVLMVEVPIAGSADNPSLRLIDRQGHARDAGLQPSVSERNGGRIVSVTIPLVTVAPGDYVIEITLSPASGRKAHVGFRVVP